MDTQVLHIKNVVCRRCIISVREILLRYAIGYKEISLGEVVLDKKLNPVQLKILKKEFGKVGFEIIEGKNEKIVNKIKSIIIAGIYDDQKVSNKNLSAILIEELNFDYSYLSSIFSSVEGISIQNFENKIKTERIKELLEYDEVSISEIAFSVGYNSAAYLSTAFKKATGLSPSQYRLKHIKTRNNLDAY